MNRHMHISGLPMSSLFRWLYLRCLCFVHSNSLKTRAPPTWACSNQHNGTSSLKFKSRERTDNPNRIDEAHDDGGMRVHNTGYVSCRQKKQTSSTVLDSGSDRVEVQHPRASIPSDLRRHGGLTPPPLLSSHSCETNPLSPLSLFGLPSPGCLVAGSEGPEGGGGG